MRVKRGFKARRRRKKVLKLAKGFRGGRRLFRMGSDTVNKAMMYSYRNRKAMKRDYRKLWIVRINAAVRMNNLNYSSFICGLKRSNVELDRKVLAELAISDPDGFAQIANLAAKALS